VKGMIKQAYELRNKVLLASEAEDKEFRIFFDLTQNHVKKAILTFRKLEG
jgi:hypothetical protein